MAYLAVLSWATLCLRLGAGAVYHGYPWWHVVQGGSIIARSLAYVCAISVVLLVSCWAAHWVFRCVRHVIGAWHSQLFWQLGFIKLFVLLVAISTPIALLLYFYVGILSLYRLVVFLTSILLISLIFHKIGNTITITNNFKGFYWQ